LTAAINSAAATSITVANADFLAQQSLPTLASGYYFVVQVDGEQMAVTGLTLAAGNTATLTVTRALNATTATTHAANASVFLVSDQRTFVSGFNDPAKVSMGSFQGTGSLLIVTTNSDAVVHAGTSLRDAITTANTDAAAGRSDLIVFASNVDGQTITLTQGTLALTGVGGTITINGGAQITVSGGNSVSDFSVAVGANVAINGLTITGASSSVNGGGIKNAGTLSVTNSTLTGNTAVGGGAHRKHRHADDRRLQHDGQLSNL